MAPLPLTGMRNQDGPLLRWPEGQRLMFFVDIPSFAGDIPASAIVQHLLRATADWEAVCGVRFERVYDVSVALFVVRFNPNRVPGLMATAFFPNDPISDRILNIYPDFNKTGYDLIGILRHELGHILGFRHEHPGEATTYRGASSIPLTVYDQGSVMHYPVPGGSTEFHISAYDAEGAQRCYGPPTAK